MKLPNREYALVSKKKIKDYLLSQIHPVGRLKAKFFYSVGFDQEDAESLKLLLLKIASENDVINVISSKYGKKYIIEGAIQFPKERSVLIQTVWIIEHGKKYPRFVTAYPV